MKDSAKLAKKLEENVRLYYGTPARKFLNEFLKEPEEYVKRIQRRMKKFLRSKDLKREISKVELPTDLRLWKPLVCQLLTSKSCQ